MARPTDDPREDAALLAGDAAAFGTFYRRHEDAILGYFLRRTGQPELAADLTAEAFAQALTAKARFDRSLGEPRAWLFGIARNLLARSLERRRVEDAARRTLGMEPIVLDDTILDSIAGASDELAVAALALLPDDQAVAVAGRVVDELGYDELAAKLDCSQSVVRKRVSRGLRTLRAQLEGRP
jgi:RNA polymerase sigma-70 factor (ECF subfamily)